MKFLSFKFVEIGHYGSCMTMTMNSFCLINSSKAGTDLAENCLFEKKKKSIFFFSKICPRWKSGCRRKTCTPAFYFAVEHIIIKPSSFYCICKVSCYNWLSQLFILFSSLLAPLHYKTTPQETFICPCHVVCTVSLKMVEAFPLELSPVMKM